MIWQPLTAHHFSNLVSLFHCYITRLLPHRLPSCSSNMSSMPLGLCIYSVWHTFSREIGMICILHLLLLIRLTYQMSSSSTILSPEVPLLFHLLNICQCTYNHLIYLSFACLFSHSRVCKFPEGRDCVYFIHSCTLST